MTKTDSTHPPEPSRPSTHPLRGDLWTPNNQEIVELLWRMRDKHGTWRQVAYLTGKRLKVLRRLRSDNAPKAISMSMLDELITATGVGSLDDYVWFEADDLVKLGIWDKPADPVDGYPTEWKRRRKRY